MTRSQTVAVQSILPTGEFGPFRGRAYRRLMAAALRVMKHLPNR